MATENFKDLDIWKKSMDLCEKVYQYSKKFPKEEQYGLVTQMRRSAVSIPANIAEGFGRRSNNEFRRFLSIAKGSLLELETYIELAQRFDYLPNTELAEVYEDTDHLGKMITLFSKNMY